MLKVKIDDSGLKKHMRRLKELAKEEKVALKDLLNQQFIKKYTKFNSLEDMLQNYSLTVNTVDEFKIIQESDEWNAYIRQHTTFENWQDMLNTAVVERLKKNLSEELR